MILLDLNQVMYSNLSIFVTKLKNTEVNESLLRHMVLNSIRSNRVKFVRKFGKLVICCDSPNSWRKTSFPYYKASRKKARESLGIDWPSVIAAMENIRSELKTYFEYPVIKVDTAEADDIIATLVNQHITSNTNEPVLILSGDKDFIQLHDNKLVKQYDPVKKRWITHDNPESYLIEHIIRGDVGDGIPNILSDGNTFVLSKRQKRISAAKLETLKNDALLNNTVGYKRNKTLIDLNSIPLNIKNSVLSEFNNEISRPRNVDLLKYFMDKRLKNLMELIEDF